MKESLKLMGMLSIIVMCFKRIFIYVCEIVRNSIIYIIFQIAIDTIKFATPYGVFYYYFFNFQFAYQDYL